MLKGRIININSGFYKVLLEDDSVITVRARGKLRNQKALTVNTKSLSKKATITDIKASPKVGDIVFIENEMIDHMAERKNEMIRPDIANVDQILLVFAAKEPDFSFYLLDLFIANIVKKNIKPIIVISKIDKLTEKELEDLENSLNYYEKLGYPSIFVDSKQKINTDIVMNFLRNKITVLSGQTGAGKSTLINALIPDFNLQTQEISYALGRGKHTTRESNLYQYEDALIGDTPGFSKLDILEITGPELPSLFVEFKPYNCRFKDCIHTENSLGCAIHAAALSKEILPSRYESYLKMLKQINEERNKL